MRSIVVLMMLALAGCGARTGLPWCEDGEFYVSPEHPSDRYASREELGTCEPWRTEHGKCADDEWCAPDLTCDGHLCRRSGMA